MAIYRPRREACNKLASQSSEGTNPADNLISDNQPPELQGNKFLFKLPSLVFCYSSPSKTNPAPSFSSSFPTVYLTQGRHSDQLYHVSFLCKTHNDFQYTENKIQIPYHSPPGPSYSYFWLPCWPHFSTLLSSPFCLQLALASLMFLRKIKNASPSWLLQSLFLLSGTLFLNMCVICISIQNSWKVLLERTFWQVCLK